MADLQSCPVCSKIMGIFRGAQENPASDASVDLGEFSLLIDASCPHADSIRRMWEAMGGDGPPARWSAEMRYAHVYESVEFAFSFDGREEMIVPVDLVNRPDEPGHAGIARVLDPGLAEPSVLRAWYDECLGGHGPRCEEPEWTRLQPGELATPTWLVDVVDECVVPSGPSTSRYITISYTWGRVDCLMHRDSNVAQLRERGALHPDRAPKIPRTVRDAMGVTRLLGERYLWVDSLCINQDSAATSKDLHAMHHIYANSSVCLVAVAGKDAAHGLRGVKGVSSEPRDPNQIILDIAGGEKLSWTQWPAGSYPVRPDDARQGSAYDERGWTFQEWTFAKRKLIFTDGPLRWMCDKRDLGEETLQGLTHDSIMGMEMPPTLWMANQDPSLDRIDGVASRFNTRYFTFEADALSGFLGIQNHLDGKFSGGLNYGHPEMFFDMSLLWKSKGLPQGLVRRLDPPGVKSGRPSPPTWSWMGWRGEFMFPSDGEFTVPSRWFDDGFTEPVAQWFGMRSPEAPAQDRRPINCTWHQHRILAKNKDPVPLEGWKKVTDADGLEYYSRAEVSPGEPTGQLRGPKHGYPIPLRNKTLPVEPIEQLPFLFSKTSRCRLAVKSGQASPGLGVELTSLDGESAGFLWLHHGSDLRLLLASEIVELVAVAKGWTTDLAEFLVAFQSEEDRAGPQKTSWAERKGRDSNRTRHDCYFVLCVEWEDGVAKRRASGKVEAKVWERHMEPVELILG